MSKRKWVVSFGNRNVTVEATTPAEAIVFVIAYANLKERCHIEVKPLIEEQDRVLVSGWRHSRKPHEVFLVSKRKSVDEPWEQLVSAFGPREGALRPLLGASLETLTMLDPAGNAMEVWDKADPLNVLDIVFASFAKDRHHKGYWSWNRVDEFVDWLLEVIEIDTETSQYVGLVKAAVSKWQQSVEDREEEKRAKS